MMDILFGPDFNLELLNGSWAIAAFSLMVICGFYLQHELRARRIVPFGTRTQRTDGIRVAMAIATLSLGVLLRSGETWRWRIFGGDLNQDIVTAGGIIAVVGFVCLVREKSVSLYGRTPWICTLIALVAYNALSVFFHLR